MRNHLKTVLVVSGVLLISGSATAGAAGLMSGLKIQKNSIPMNRLTEGTQKKINKGYSGQAVVPGPRGAAGATGAAGAAGAAGAKGDKGAKGDTGTAVYIGENWSLIDRNTIGSPVGALRSGPSAGAVKPPLGVGSLGFAVKDATEKVAFGNQVDFAGNKIANVKKIGFNVFWTGEDKKISANNLPNITFEVDPSGPANNNPTLPDYDPAIPNYSSLVFVPSGTPKGTALPVNTWNAIDATSPAAGYWYFTNLATATKTDCGQSSTCSFEEMQLAIDYNYKDMTVSSLAVGKGRDFEWQGAIDALRYNDAVYDFEPFGVITRTS